MRTIIVLIGFLCLLTNIYGQGSNPSFSPEDTFSFVKIKLINPDGSPYAGLVVLKGEKGHVVKVTTNKDGRVKAKVPFDEVYSVHCGEATCMKTITISNFPYVTYNYQAYTKRFIYFTFTYQNPQGKRLKGEEVVVTSDLTKKTYKDTTNEKGQVYFYLPFEPQFKVSVAYHPNIRTLNPTEQHKEYKLMSMTFTWMGSKEKERRARYMDSLSRAYYTDIVELMDSLVKAGDKDAIAKLDRFLPIGYSDVEWVEKMLKEKAAAYKKAYKNDPTFFELKKKTVLAALTRLNKRYSSQIIVTDITGSMYPYMEEVLLWHALQFMGDRGTKYLFFI